MIGVVARVDEHDVVREFFELFKTPWEFCRPNRRYEVVLHAGEGSDRPPAKVVVAYGSQLTVFDEDGKRRPGEGRQDTTLSWNGDLIPVFGRCADFPADGGSASLVLERTGEPVVSTTRANGSTVVRVGYDLFGEIHRLLTTGQPARHAGIPTLERHIAFLRQTIVSAGVPLVEIPPIPPGYRFIACLTHDLDHPFIRLHRGDHTMFGFLYRALVRSAIDVSRGRMRPRTLGRNWMAALSLPLVHAGLVKDFWAGFDRYLEIEKGLGSTFFVIPRKGSAGRTLDGPAPRIRAAAYGVADIAAQLKDLRAAGCEIALHGIDAWLDTPSGVRERRLVAQVTGDSPTGVRMHWLFSDGRTPARLEEAGFGYDSTCGYNGAVGFRAGTLQAFRPPAARRLLELPLHIMDTALFAPSHLDLTSEAARELVWPLVDEAERYGGALTINWHDRSLAPERLWGGFYVELVNELKRRGAWFPTAAAAVEWFRRRRAAACDALSQDGEGADVPASAGRQPDLPGLRLRVHSAWHPGRFTDEPLRTAAGPAVTV
jgi:hypothetical protein